MQSKYARRKKYPFASSETIRQWWTECATQHERDEFERSYRKYVVAFQIPQDVIDPDVVFGTKDSKDGLEQKLAAEKEEEAIRYAYGTGGISDAVGARESDSIRPEPRTMVPRASRVHGVLDRLPADDAASEPWGDSDT